ncbi:MAG: hypothetical protein AAB397_00665 [Patescibacteria group bacterium]
MDILAISQTVFYIVAALAMIILGALFLAAAYYLISIASHIKKISKNIGQISEDAKEGLEKTIGNLSSLPFVSFFFKKASAKKDAHQKGRKPR